jgi:hypothetical protein
MKLWKWLGIGIVSACGLYAFHEGVSTLMRMHKWQGLTPSDWGTWAGAVGTVATLVGTIWLATDSERKRRRDELELAVITAAEFALRVPSMQLTLTAVRDMLPLTRNGSYGDVYANCYEQIQSAGVWSTESLKPLVVVSGHAAAHLAFASTQIRSISASFVEGKNSEMPHVTEVHQMEEFLTRQLDQAIELLDQPLRACVQFLIDQGFGNDLPA